MVVSFTIFSLLRSDKRKSLEIWKIN